MQKQSQIDKASTTNFERGCSYDLHSGTVSDVRHGGTYHGLRYCRNSGYLETHQAVYAWGRVPQRPYLEEAGKPAEQGGVKQCFGC